MSEASGVTLKRAVGPAMLMLYGVGSMLGAGIYGLVGRAAGVMGSAVWIGFLVAMVAALLTGISYASIASRHPKAAGAAYAVHRAYRRPWLSYLVGLAVVASGLASITTQSKVVGENLNVLFGTELPVVLLAIGFLLIVGGIVYRGITESLAANAVCTIIEAAGLVLVIAVGARYWGSQNLLQLPPATEGGAAQALSASLMLQGAVLTFFSFLGFEDMINVSEETKDPERTLPIAMIGAMVLVSMVYMAVSITAVSVVPWRELSEAPAPLRAVIERAAPWFPAVGFTVITLFAVSNTALINYVMGSRLLYGMARQGLLPSFLGKVHGRRQTPHLAVAVLFLIVVALQFAGDISQLAAATVLLLLGVFIVVNIALIVLKAREGDLPGRFNAPYFVPALGAAVCAAMMTARVMDADWRAPAIAGGLLLLILVLYVLTGKGRAERVSAYWEGED